MSQVICGLLISNGRLTMLEISRWTEGGGSYRTIQRWYHSQLIWLQIMWILFTSQLWKAGHEYIAAGDEVVFGKAGKETHGVGYFFSGLQQRVIPGLSFFVFSLIDVQERHMNVKEIAVTNAANLSFFMVNFIAILLHPFRETNPEFSILDLKSHYRGWCYVSETIKLLPQKPDGILLAEIFEQIARLGMVHPVFEPVSAA